jgi:hypothetical protein
MIKRPPADVGELYGIAPTVSPAFELKETIDPFGMFTPLSVPLVPMKRKLTDCTPATVLPATLVPMFTTEGTRETFVYLLLKAARVASEALVERATSKAEDIAVRMIFCAA